MGTKTTNRMSPQSVETTHRKKANTGGLKRDGRSSCLACRARIESCLTQPPQKRLVIIEAQEMEQVGDTRHTEIESSVLLLGLIKYSTLEVRLPRASRGTMLL
jgi:hypothetical protein